MFVALRFINHSNVHKDFFAIFDLKEEVGWCFCWISLFETARTLARSLAKVITATADINIYVYLGTAWICMFIVYFCMIYRMKCSSYRNNSHGKCIHIHSDDACTLHTVRDILQTAHTEHRHSCWPRYLDTPDAELRIYSPRECLLLTSNVCSQCAHLWKFLSISLWYLHAEEKNRITGYY